MTGPDYLTREEIQDLPLWAKVAFAARCCRHLQPLLRKLWPGASPDVLLTFDRAIAMAELSAAKAALAGDLEKVARDVQVYAASPAGVARLIPYGTSAANFPSISSGDTVRYSAAQAVLYAAEAALTASRGESDHCADATSQACGWALHSMHFLRVSGGESVFRYDLRCLRASVEKRDITESGPVSSDVFALEKELQTYRRLLPSLLEEQGKYVVIHGDQLAGTWGTYEDALQAAYTAFGLNAFLVKQIQAEDAFEPAYGG